MYVCDYLTDWRLEGSAAQETAGTGNEMENELLLLKNEEFEYPELELETFVAEDVLTGESESNIEQENLDPTDLTGAGDEVSTSEGQLDW